VIRRLDEEALARLDDVVVQVTLAGHPHAAAQDGEFTGQALHTNRGVKLHGRGTCLGKDLRSHHESPVGRNCCFVVTAPVSSARPRVYSNEFEQAV
jgi:hypothetical protein